MQKVRAKFAQDRDGGMVECEDGKFHWLHVYANVSRKFPPKCSRKSSTSLIVAVENVRT